MTPFDFYLADLESGIVRDMDLTAMTREINRAARKEEAVMSTPILQVIRTVGAGTLET